MNKNTPKRYRLLKDAPDAKANTILTKKGITYTYIDQKKMSAWYDERHVENNPEWFEEIVEPERIEVKDIERVKNFDGNELERYRVYVTQPIPEDKFPAIRSAIENVLNGTSTLYDCHQEALEEMSKMYSASQLEEAERKAFEAGKLITINIRKEYKQDESNFNDIWGNIFVVYPDFNDYKSHLINKDTK